LQESLLNIELLSGQWSTPLTDWLFTFHICKFFRWICRLLRGPVECLLPVSWPGQPSDAEGDEIANFQDFTDEEIKQVCQLFHSSAGESKLHSTESKKMMFESPFDFNDESDADVELLGFHINVHRQLQHRALNFVEIFGTPQNTSNWELNGNKRSFSVREKTENDPYRVSMFRVFYLTKPQLKNDYSPANRKIFMSYLLEKDVYFGIVGKSIKVWSLVHNNCVKIFKWRNEKQGAGCPA
jgi:hypothetical protein